MILINIIILYFVQIAHADDFPSTGPCLASRSNYSYCIIKHYGTTHAMMHDVI